MANSPRDRRLDHLTIYMTKVGENRDWQQETIASFKKHLGVTK
jgi:hypothetical protein